MKTKTDAKTQQDCDELIWQMSKIRRSSGLSQNAVADLCEMPQATISLIERGGTVPGLLTMLKMANAMGYRLTLAPIHGGTLTFSDAQEVGHMISFDERTLRHIRTLFEEYGYAGVLQRGPVCELLGMEASGVSILFTKLKEAGILEQIPGLRRGNYRFVRGKIRLI